MLHNSYQIISILLYPTTKELIISIYYLVLDIFQELAENQDLTHHLHKCHNTKIWSLARRVVSGFNSWEVQLAILL